MSESLFQALQQNDKDTFLQILKNCTQNPHLTSTDREKWTTLYTTAASQPKYKECLELLLQYGVGMFFHKDDQLENTKTALYIASENGCDDNVLVLLHAGCNPNIQTNSGETALHIASYKGCLKIVEYLLNYSASINAQNKYGSTPLHMAAESGQLKVSQLLLEKGADLQSADSNGCLPIHLGYNKSWYFKIARLLLEHDLTTINSQNSAGNTPLMYVFIHQYEINEYIHSLLEYDDKTEFRNERGRIAECNEYIHFLLKNGAKTEFCNKRGKTVLHLAAKTKNHEILPLLFKITDMKWMEQCLSSSFIDCSVENDKEYSRTYVSFDSFLGSSSQFSETESHFDNVEDDKEYRYFRRLLYLNSSAGSHFGSLLKYALRSFDVKTVSTLLTSELPKCILQIPIIRKYDYIHEPLISIHSPLAYLFESFNGAKEEEFNACLHLLLKHKIATMDDFNRVIPVKWPVYNYYFYFRDPFFIILNKSHLRSKQRYYVNLLIENDVTADYILQCYHDNKRPFVSSCGYDYFLMYRAVKDTINRSNPEMLKLMITNSVILEPDILVKYFFSTCGQMNITDLSLNNELEKPISIKGCDKIYEVYLYLISLKPLCFTHFERPKCLEPYEEEGPLWRAIMLEQPSAFKISEEFHNVTLQQLCRTVIRQHLRGPTLEDNLRNFKKNILELPLPNFLKDYLLFKN